MNDTNVINTDMIIDNILINIKENYTDDDFEFALYEELNRIKNI